MALESATYISDLVATNPVDATDTGASMGDHLKLIKATIKTTFPNVAGAVTPTHTQLNQVANAVWTEKQTFNNYTLLGTVASGAPAIKMKKLTGTTSASLDGAATVAHGLTSTKIIGVQVWVDGAAGRFLPGMETGVTGYQYGAYFDATNVTVRNHSSNAGNILATAFTVLITYEE